MLIERIKRRCQSARFVCVAKVGGHEIVFNKKSFDGSGKANIIKVDDGVEIYGALFEIELNEQQALDNAEGRDYRRNDDFVVTRMDTGEQMSTSIYIAKADKTENNLRPYDWYKDVILAGAWQHQFPEQYVEQLNAIQSVVDVKANRDSRVEAIAAMKESGWQRS